jgi:AAA+ superfamily predicted ATPase
MLLIILKGVGKTSTAECVADLTERPLFPVTCGDIGETAAEVQESLDYNFQLAHKWGCVLLLDEAESVYSRFRVLQH